MKKFCKVCMAVLAVLALALSVMEPGAVSAANLKKAKTVKVDKTYKGKTTSGSYEHAFKVKLTKNGNLKLVTKTLKGKSWFVEIFNSKGKVLHTYYTDTKKSGTQTVPIGLKKGTYYIVLSGNLNKTYSLKLKFAKGEYYEKESNDTIKTATPVKKKKYYTASLQQFTDKDYYKFTVKKKQKVKLTVTNGKNLVWDYLIVNSKGKQYGKTMRTDTRGKNGKETFAVTLPKGTFYLLVRYGSSKPYKFKLTY